MDEQERLKEQDDERMVNEAFQRLLDTYLRSHHRKKVALITQAFNFARKAHEGVRRLSGEPYIMHPIAVAQIASEEIGLGSTSICSALLHDVVEDTDYTIADIENIFGPKIAQIVDGLTKISGGIFGDKTSAQVENLKKLLLTMSDDIRVILIKIADRLHNMRTLGSQPPHKQYKIAGETLNIYAPLAYRLGLNKIKEELEDLSFGYEHPEECELISQRLSEIDNNLKSIYSDFIAPMQAELDRHGIQYTIKARIKRPYSIWKKMQTKHVSFEDVYDILAVRIVFRPKNLEDEVAECLQIYGYITKGYTPHPERFRDWLNHPKANGYQALHTTLMSKVGQWIEVQIRSERMDEIAEQGFAAHWKYKDGEKTAEESESELDKWLHTIKEILDDPQPSGMDFLDTIKLNLYSNELFVLTPRGDVRKMPVDSTVLDFAFTIHTFVGTHCIGAKVNHKLVPLNYVLRGGDQIEVLTGKESQVRREWLNIATTGKAQNKIQALLRREDRERQREGEQMLTDFLHQSDMEPSSMVADKLCALHELKSREELYSAIGAGRITLGQADLDHLRNRKNSQGWGRYLNIFKRNTPAESAPEDDKSKPTTKVDKKKTFVLNEETLDQVSLCPTCHPIPGDEVLGHVDKKGHITIHKRQCPEANRLKTADGNQLLAVRWDTHKKRYFPTVIRVEGIDNVGVLYRIAGILSQQLNINIRRLTIETNNGIFQGEFNIEVHDVEDVRTICRDLKRIEDLKLVTRIS
ncbi:MAG: bifunctional (p)ppGpp synthetase/guanosine-3',5'-bis(diphosphate) 3'-pyrophosphohydrolase [Bacteroidaceae bacterium]|nr:bifunctional (p)ppGpp synthetase/guanosine-3',5'-bis(diphosphate) 3'-pyrophosphohydrolase [Bacteroidaceae bacterium]